MKSWRALTALLISILVIIFLILAIQWRKPAKNLVRENIEQELHEEEVNKHAYGEYTSGETIALSDEALKSFSLKTAPVRSRSLEREIETTAVIEADETKMSHVSPRTEGRVIEVKAFLGDEVTRGQTLAELDSIELGQAKAEYLKAKANLEVARANHQREGRLYKQKISSERDYLEARGEFLRSDAELRSARETLLLLGLSNKEIDTLSWGGGAHPPSHFPLLAPIDGTVVEKHIVSGELLKPDDKPYTIADLSNLWILVDIYEKDLRWVQSGIKVRLKVDAYPDEYVQGTITYVSDILDESTRTARARVEIANPRRNLKPGMFATATISIATEDAKDTIVIPDSAIHRLRGKPVAFLEQSNGHFVVRELKLGKDSGSYVEVLEGLKEGDRIVAEGGFYLKSAVLKEEMGEGHGH